MPRNADQQLPSALQFLYQHGSITLVGASSRGQIRVTRARRIGLVVFGSLGFLGVIAVTAGIVLRDTVGWAIAALVGFFLLFVSFVGVVVYLAVIMLHRYRSVGEQKPVVITPQGFWLRGVGPIHWHEVQPPVYKWIVSKHDINGKYAVMPLTQAGLDRVNSNMSKESLLVGPKPYLHFTIPYVLLPGIAGFSEDDTVQLFQAAYSMFAPRPSPRGHR